MNCRKKRYCKIRTLAELQAEREKLDNLMEMQQMELCSDWMFVKEWFSPSSIGARCMGYVASTSSVFQRVMGVYGRITDAIRRRREKKRRAQEPQCSCGCRH